MLRVILGFSLAMLSAFGQSAPSAAPNTSAAHGDLTPAEQAVPKLSAEELKSFLKTGKVVFVDVRDEKELAELGTLKQRVHIPLADIEKRANEIPKDALIITACNRGVRASKAAAKLKVQGYAVIGAAGIKDWKDDEFPLVSGAKK
jgi:rhodanese-related sulfurtransferase